MTSNPVHTAIRPARHTDSSTWGRMRDALWPGEDDRHASEIASYFAGDLAEPLHVLLAEIDDQAIGVAELSVRTELPGFPGKRVGYIEGLYVEPHVRNRGVARALVAASRRWARQEGCDGFASDRDDRTVIDQTFPAGD